MSGGTGCKRGGVVGARWEVWGKVGFKRGGMWGRGCKRGGMGESGVQEGRYVGPVVHEGRYGGNGDAREEVWEGAWCNRRVIGGGGGH